MSADITADPNILNGISHVINPGNVKPGTKYEDIERLMVSNGEISEVKDPGQAFKEELNMLTKSLGLSLEATPKSAITPSSAARSASPKMLKSYDRESANVGGKYASDSSDESDSDGGSAKESTHEPSGGNSYGPNPGGELQRMTQEQERHRQLETVMGSIDSGAQSMFNLEREQQEDMKSAMLEEIDFLWSSLEEDGADLSRIPRPQKSSSYDDVESVLKILRHKNDRTRYCSLAEETFLLGAYAIEDLFDGKKMWFGHNPDLTNWHKQVQVKLRRMRYDTSNLVSGVMQDYNIGPGLRIILELIPNMLMHAKRRKSQFGTETIYNEQELHAAMSNIRNIDEGTNVWKN